MDDNIISDERLQQILELKNVRGWGEVDLKPKNEEYKLVTIKDVKLHEFVYINPPHDKDEFEKLMESIASNGQIEPVKIWEKRGTKFIIDGRHRYLALQKLGADFIKYVNISSNTTKEELKTLVIESENKRQMTPAQNAIRAWKDYSENHKVTGKSMRTYASRYHTGHATISRCNTIAEELGSNVLDELFMHKKVELGGKYLSSLNQIMQYIKDKQPKRVKGRNMPKSAEAVVNGMKSLRDNDDIEAMAYILKTAKNFLSELTQKA